MQIEIYLNIFWKYLNSFNYYTHIFTQCKLAMNGFFELPKFWRDNIEHLRCTLSCYGRRKETPRVLEERAHHCCHVLLHEVTASAVSRLALICIYIYIYIFTLMHMYGLSSVVSASGGAGVCRRGYDWLICINWRYLSQLWQNSMASISIFLHSLQARTNNTSTEWTGSSSCLLLLLLINTVRHSPEIVGGSRQTAVGCRHLPA